MAVRDKATIKSYFQRGFKPTAQNYIDLVDSYQDTGSSDAFTPIGQALVNASTQASARTAIGIDFVTTAQAVAGALATGGMNPVLVKNAIQGFAAFATTAQAIAGAAATVYMSPVLTRNLIENSPNYSTLINSIATVSAGANQFIYTSAANEAKAWTVTPYIRSLMDDDDALAARGTLGANNADNLSSGTVPTARLGSGTPDATTFLRGDQTWATPSPLVSSGAIGSYILAQNTSGGGITNGSTVNGATGLLLAIFSSGGAIGGSGSPTGTWRNMSGRTIANNEYGLWQRTA